MLEYFLKKNPAFMLKNIMKFVPLGTSQFGPLNFEELALFIKRTKQERDGCVSNSKDFISKN